MTKDLLCVGLMASSVGSAQAGEPDQAAFELSSIYLTTVTQGKALNLYAPPSHHLRNEALASRNLAMGFPNSSKGREGSFSSS